MEVLKLRSELSHVTFPALSNVDGAFFCLKNGFVGGASEKAIRLMGPAWCKRFDFNFELRFHCPWISDE